MIRRIGRDWLSRIAWRGVGVRPAVGVRQRGCWSCSTVVLQLGLHGSRLRLGGPPRAALCAVPHLPPTPSAERAACVCAEGGARLPDIDVGGAADPATGLALFCSPHAHRFARPHWAAPWSWWRLLWRSNVPVLLAEFPLVCTPPHRLTLPRHV